MLVQTQSNEFLGIAKATVYAFLNGKL